MPRMSAPINRPGRVLLTAAAALAAAAAGPAWAGKEMILGPAPAAVRAPAPAVPAPVPPRPLAPVTVAPAAVDTPVQIGQARRIPGQQLPEERVAPPQIDPGAVPPPQPNLPREFIPVPDRWRLADAIGVEAIWWDPYNQNYIKGDRPILGTKDWFLNLLAISDTVVEPRKVPTPTAPNSTNSSSTSNIFSDGTQTFYNQNIILSASLIKGNTAYKPPDYEFRLTPVINFNRAEAEEVGFLERDPRQGTTREDFHIALQEGFFDYHIRNVSDRYDFDSIRIGIQPFSTDFRGFLFQDNQMGIRLFGSRDNNIFQYNLAWFRRLDKDTNSGLNDVGVAWRDDDVFVANLYIQDMPMLGFVSQFTVVHNRNGEDDAFFFNENDFIERPASLGDERLRDYQVTYFGFNGDGHFDRANLTVSAYYAWGQDGHNVLTGDPPGEETEIGAYFFAAEPSVDLDWIRLRGSFLYASGDSDPFDDKEEGFAAIFENPQFAGGDTSYWIRQGIPFIGGGGVALTQRNGVLAELRTTKEHGQSNFNNPGIMLYGFGTDFDILPELRLSTNVNKLRFVDTSNIEAIRNQGVIDEDIGVDVSAALIYRPFFSQNIVFRLSGAVLFAGEGFKDLYTTESGGALAQDHYYSVLGNLILTF